MTDIRHSSAWGDDEIEATPPTPVVVPEPQPHPTPSLDTEPIHGYAGQPEILSGQLSHALVLAFQEERPAVGGWGALSRRLGIHPSLLQRLRRGIGNVSSVDDVAAKLGWQIIIRRPRA